MKLVITLKMRLNYLIDFACFYNKYNSHTLDYSLASNTQVRF